MLVGPDLLTNHRVWSTEAWKGVSLTPQVQARAKLSKLRRATAMSQFNFPDWRNYLSYPFTRFVASLAGQSNCLGRPHEAMGEAGKNLELHSDIRPSELVGESFHFRPQYVELSDVEQNRRQLRQIRAQRGSPGMQHVRGVCHIGSPEEAHFVSGKQRPIAKFAVTWSVKVAIANRIGRKHAAQRRPLTVA